MLHRRGRVLPALILTAVTALSACSGDPGEILESSSAPPTSRQPSYSAPPVAPAVNPLNGTPGLAPAEVFVVKIDDTSGARPQVGISAADIVYIEQVEGGLTRLMAVFGTTMPSQVGPVRSVRSSDTQILAQYGPIGLAFSGGAPPQLAIVAGANIVNGSADVHPQFYRRDGGRRAPYNLLLDLPAMAAALPAVGAHSVGFEWGSYPALAAAAPGVQLSVAVGTTGVDFRFDPASGRYVRYINGAAQFDATGPVVSTANVIVMFCQVGPDGVGADVNGSPTIGTTTVGSGPVVVFRDGRRIDGVWTRASPGSSTTLTDASGGIIQLAPGGAWIALAANGAPLLSG